MEGVVEMLAEVQGDRTCSTRVRIAGKGRKVALAAPSELNW